MKDLIIDYVIPILGMLTVIFYFVRALRTISKHKAHEAASNSYQDISSQEPDIVPLVNGENVANTPEQVQRLTTDLPRIDDGPKEEIYYINYDEAFDATNSKIEIQRNMRPYFEALIRHTASSRESLYIIDYPEHGKPMEENTFFYQDLQAHQIEYYNTIESLVQNRGVNYVRVLQLPLGTDESEMSDNAIVEYTIRKLSDLTQGHINRMLNFANFKLYIIRKAIINYSQALIDRRKHLVELDRYDLESRARPNRLTISTASANANDRLTRMIFEEHDYIKLVLTGHTPVSKQQIDIAVANIAAQNTDVVKGFLEYR